MNPSHLHSVSKTVYPHRAKRLKLPPLKENPDAQPTRSFHAALIKKWGLQFPLNPPGPKPVLKARTCRSLGKDEAAG
jgi:hypothetical protein